MTMSARGTTGVAVTLTPTMAPEGTWVWRQVSAPALVLWAPGRAGLAAERFDRRRSAAPLVFVVDEMNVSSPPAWRLKLVNADKSRETDHRFHDLRSLHSAAALLRGERPDVVSSSPFPQRLLQQIALSSSRSRAVFPWMQSNRRG